MVESLNTKVYFTEKGTSFMGLGSYGHIMIGDHAFEFYDDRDVNRNIQIPWEAVDYVIASKLFKGRKIPRFAIRTTKGVDYSFATKEPHRALRAIREYIPADHILWSLSFFQVLSRGVKNLWGKITHKQ